MGFKSPEQALEEFLAAQPSWIRKLLEHNNQLSAEEFSAVLTSDWQQTWFSQIDEYERLLKRIPSRWREYRNKCRREALSRIPSAQHGRPRKDALAEEAMKLHQAGKSYAKIAKFLNNRYGPDTTTPEAVRKLVSARKLRPTPDKTQL